LGISLVESTVGIELVVGGLSRISLLLEGTVAPLVSTRFGVTSSDEASFPRTGMSSSLDELVSLEVLAFLIIFFFVGSLRIASIFPHALWLV
jgi:hypothetical protein